MIGSGNNKDCEEWFFDSKYYLKHDMQRSFYHLSPCVSYHDSVLHEFDNLIMYFKQELFGIDQFQFLARACN